MSLSSPPGEEGRPGMHYVGVDVSKATFDTSDPSGKSRGRFENSSEGASRLIDWVRERSSDGAHVILEPTSTYHHLLVDVLAGADIPFTVINPYRTKAWSILEGRRAKTDRVDAQLLASLGEGQRPEPSGKPDALQERLKSLRRHREWLEGQLRAARNRMDTAGRSPWTHEGVIESLEATIGQLEEQVAAVTRELEEIVEGDELLASSAALLETIPGIGRRTAMMILSELPAAAGCKSSRAWVAFSGLCPEPHQSGRTSWSRLSRAGGARIRRGLYMAAVVSMRFNPSIASYVARLAERGTTGKKAVVAAMNRLLRICFGVLKNRRPFDQELHLKYLAV